MLHVHRRQGGGGHRQHAVHLMASALERNCWNGRRRLRGRGRSRRVLHASCPGAPGKRPPASPAPPRTHPSHPPLLLPPFLPCSAPGYYNPDLNSGSNAALRAKFASCQPCAANSFSAAGATSCTPCALGSMTDGEGQSKCESCSKGFYSPKAGTACVAAPAGTFVNTVGATM